MNVEFYIKDNNLFINFNECKSRFFELEKISFLVVLYIKKKNRKI